MNATIETTPNGYGFGYDWTLIVDGKSFFLGQDVKFCQRVLGMTPRQVVDEIGDNDLRKEETKQALASLIIDILGIEDVTGIQPWELSCQ